MSRWSKCPGSVRLSEGIESRSSAYAEEGTEAHALAEKMLRGENAVAEQEMLDAVVVYVDAVRELARGGELLIEHRFDLSEVHDGLFGTADAVIWQPKEKTLVVMDYKHGAGIPVKVEGNPQLMYYALGALLTLKYPAVKVRIGVVQPRCEHPAGPVRWWEISAIDLIDFSADLKEYARATEQDTAPLVPGEHCRFCPAAALCPKLVATAQEVAKLDFRPNRPYDPEQLRLALDSRPALQAWMKALDEFAYAEAEQGRTPPGYKLVAKRATRKWRNEADVIEATQKVGLDVFEKSVKSPAAVEKMVGKKEFAALYGEMCAAESSGHALVPESDSRPAVRLDATSEFTLLPE